MTRRRKLGASPAEHEELGAEADRGASCARSYHAKSSGSACILEACPTSERRAKRASELRLRLERGESQGRITRGTPPSRRGPSVTACRTPREGSGNRARSSRSSTSWRISASTRRTSAAGPSERAFDDCLRLCERSSAARMKNQDRVRAGAPWSPTSRRGSRFSQRAGIPVEVYAIHRLVPHPPVRGGVDLELIAKRSAEAIDRRGEGRSPRRLRHGDTDPLAARRADDALPRGRRSPADAPLPLDTVGHATPDGVRNLIQFAKARRRRHRREGHRHRLARSQRSRPRARERPLGAGVRPGPRPRDGARHR